MPKIEYVRRYGKAQHFKRIIVRDEHGNVKTIIVKINKDDVLDALDFID